MFRVFRGLSSYKNLSNFKLKGGKSIMQGFLSFLPIVFLAFVGFMIYFVFKILGFVINATRLYRRMIARQDMMIKLLLDIRDNTKKFDENELASLAKDEGERTYSPASQ